MKQYEAVDGAAGAAAVAGVAAVAAGVGIAVVGVAATVVVADVAVVVGVVDVAVATGLPSVGIKLPVNRHLKPLLDYQKSVFERPGFLDSMSSIERDLKID